MKITCKNKSVPFSLNSVKAGMVEHERYYEWSSYQQHAGLTDDNWIDTDLAYQGMADTNEARHLRYKAYIHQAGSESERQLIGSALQRNQLTGSSRFVDEVEKRIGQRIEQRGPGRPRSKE